MRLAKVGVHALCLQLEKCHRLQLNEARAAGAHKVDDGNDGMVQETRLMVEAKAIFDFWPGSINVTAMAGGFDRKHGMVGEIVTIVVQIIVGAPEATLKMKDGRARPRKQPGVKVESSYGSKTKTEFSWGNSSQRSDSGNWHNQSDTQGNGWGNKPSNSSWDKQERSFSSQNKRDRFWGDGPQRSDPGKTLLHADSISRGNVEKRAIPRQLGRLRNFFWSNLGRGHKNAISLS